MVVASGDKMIIVDNNSIITCRVLFERAAAVRRNKASAFVARHKLREATFIARRDYASRDDALCHTGRSI